MVEAPYRPERFMLTRLPVEMEFEPGLEMLADGGVKKGAQDFKMSPRNWGDTGWKTREPTGWQRTLGKVMGDKNASLTCGER